MRNTVTVTQTYAISRAGIVLRVPFCYSFQVTFRSSVDTQREPNA